MLCNRPFVMHSFSVTVSKMSIRKIRMFCDHVGIRLKFFYYFNFKKHVKNWYNEILTLCIRHSENTKLHRFSLPPAACSHSPFERIYELMLKSETRDPSLSLKATWLLFLSLGVSHQYFTELTLRCSVIHLPPTTLFLRKQD